MKSPYALCPICSHPVERPLRPVHGARPHRAKCNLCLARDEYKRAEIAADKARVNLLKLVAKREELERKRRIERVK
jgi:hypothetical protein